MALALVVAARGLERRTTWYLASDQFAFLTFADDLRHGRVFHDPATMALLAADVPPGETADAYYQTYLWRDGRLWSRYPPGFPLLLAGATAVGGPRAAHLVNPLLYLGLLAALAWLLGILLDGKPFAAGAAAAAPWALLVLPTEVHLWGITIARDLPAHLLALGALGAACTRRFGAAGLLLGLACTIRPDALLWAASLGAIALVVRPPPRAVLRGTLGFLAGVAPLLAYNTLAQGHPLSFTQGMELRQSRGAALPFHALASVVPPLVSGGGFRLSHLPHVLPQNLHHLAAAFGLFLLPALGVLVASLRGRRLLAAALAPYLVVAVPFFSCWGRSDPRYLMGAVVVLLLATAAGAAAWCAALTDPARSTPARLRLLAATAVAVLLAPAVLPAHPRRRPVELAAGAAAMTAGTAALVTATVPLASAAGALVPAVAFAGVGLARVAAGHGARDPFQAPQVEAARSVLEAALPPGALVLTTPALGRPAENITHYTHAVAHYDGELAILRTTPAAVTRRALAAGRRVFLLLPSWMPPPLPAALLREVSRRRGDELFAWFVDPGHTADAVLFEVARPPDG